ncbi:ComEC/Rec2 family competence protein [Patescibacteria group bacterium]
MLTTIKNNFIHFILATLLVVAVFVWSVVLAETRDELEVVFLDVGQGDATFIEAPNGNQVLIDGGENRTVLSELSGVMPFYDRSIDALILSHAHSDHIGGLIEVLKRYEIGLIIEPCFKHDTAEYKTWEEIILQKDITRVCGKKGDIINLDERTNMEILLPVGDVANRKIHDAMLVLKLNYGETSFLFTGDMEKNLESYLAQTLEEELKSDVLKVGHHGSDTSTSEIFLGFVGPEYAVISVGENNKYGHPKPEILERLERFGATILRTDELGTIKIKSDGEQVTATY